MSAKRSLACLSPDGRTIFSLTHFDSRSSQDGSPSRMASPSTPSSKTTPFLTSSPYNAISIHHLPISDDAASNDDRNSDRGDFDSSSAYKYDDNPEVSGAKKFGGVAKEKLNAPRALLTADMVSALRQDPPLGLLYCDTQYSMPRSYPGAVQLALYSKSKVWLLLIGRRSPSDYESGRSSSASSTSPFSTFQRGLSSSSSPSLVKDSDYIIRSTLQPFESYLLHLSSSAKHGFPAIVRVRSAPSSQASSSDQYLAPPGSLALLTTEGTLALYHPPPSLSSSTDPTTKSRQVNSYSIMELREGIVTTPVSMATMLGYVNSSSSSHDEYEEDVTKVTDFCFGWTTYIASPDPHSPSSFLVDPSHLGELNVYFLCQNGDVYGASPVIFDHAAIKTTSLFARIEYIEHQLNHVLPPEDYEYSDVEEKKITHIASVVGGTRDDTQEDGDHRLQIEALRRSYQASLVWLKDVFNVKGRQTQKHHHSYSSSQKKATSLSLEYSTARLFSSGESSAGFFPVQIQAPILYNHKDVNFEDEEGTDNDGNGTDAGTTTPCGDAVVIEPFPCSNMDLMPGMTTFCIGRQPLTPSTMEVQIDVCLITQPLLARFDWESREDRDSLDEHHVEGRGRVLDTILYDFGDEAYPSADFEEEYLEHHHSSLYLDLLIDPVRPYTIHVGAVFGICTLALGSVPRALQEMRCTTFGLRTSTATNLPGEDEAGTNDFAFSSLALGASFSKIGFQSTVVSGDAELGHVLISQLTNGQMETVNLTAAIYMHQAALKRITQTSDNKALLTSSHEESNKKKGIDVLDSLGSFADVASPLIQQISQGLSSAGRLCGSNVMPSQADEATVSAVFQTKSTLENEVVLPLKDLYLQTRNREKVITQVCDRQKEQLLKLQSMVGELQQRSKKLIEKASALKKNDKTLSQRSECVLTTARALLPNISQKELEYFEQLKRWDMQSSEWEGKVKELKRQSTYLSNVATREKEETTGSSSTTTSRLTSDLLHPETKQTIDSLLLGQEGIISNNRKRTLELQRSLKQLAASANLHSAVS